MKFLAQNRLSCIYSPCAQETTQRAPNQRANPSLQRSTWTHLHMVLYKRFQDEAEFREKFVKPLLNRLGYYGVSEQHGTQEFGKDFVFSELHRLGGMRHYAAQVKHEEKINQGPSVDNLLSQVRQAFARPFKRADSPRECHVSTVYVFNSGEVTANAKEQLLSALQQERYGDNVHVLDGERLDALNEWATLQTDANARARLIGLRSSLRFIIEVLRGYQDQAKPNPQPLLMQGIALYLSEPVICDEEFIKALFLLWEHLEMIDKVRQMLTKYTGNTGVLAEHLPTLNNAARNALPLATALCQKLDLALEKMKPLGVS